MKRASSGFTLAELAIVTVIVGLLLGGLLTTLSTQVDLRQNSDTQKILETARDALVGFAIANGRLPCPAVSNIATDTGIEAGALGVCTAPYYGYYPAVTVGLTPTDKNGYLLDAWGNRIRYAVTTTNSNAFTTTAPAGQMKALGLSSLSPDLHVCNTSTGMTTGASAACGANASLATSAVAVVLSLGKNASTGGTGTDEIRNAKTAGSHNYRSFVSHESAPPGAANGEFDDLVTWLSQAVLYNRLVAAGAI